MTFENFAKSAKEEGEGGPENRVQNLLFQTKCILGCPQMSYYKLCGAGETISENYCQPPCLADKKIFKIKDTLEWLKQ